MKWSLRFKLAWRILTHRKAHISDDYHGHVEYCIGIKGESRRTLVVHLRTPDRIRRHDAQRLARNERIQQGAEQLGGILGGKINVG